MAEAEIDRLNIEITASGIDDTIRKLTQLHTVIRSIADAASTLGNLDLSQAVSAAEAAAKPLDDLTKNVSKAAASIENLEGKKLDETIGDIQQAASSAENLTQSLDDVKTTASAAASAINETVNPIKEATEAAQSTVNKTAKETASAAQKASKATESAAKKAASTTESAAKKASGAVKKSAKDASSAAKKSAKEQSDSAKKSSEESAEATKNYAASFASAMETVQRVASAVGSAIGAIGSVTSRIGSSLLSPFIVPFKGIASAAASAASKVSQFVSALKRILLYRAIRKILSSITTALKEGIENLYQYSKELNGEFAQSLDTVATDLLYLKNSIAAAAAPIINVLAPAFDTLADTMVEVINTFNETVAMLTGADTWTKAVKYQTEYAEAAEDATEANEELRASLLGFDEINRLDADTSSDSSSSSSDLDYSAMFTTVETTADLSGTLSGFFDPLKEAWDNVGLSVVESFTDAWSNVKGLASSIGESFSKVWQSDLGISICENILGTVQGIVDTVGNLAEGFRKAWDEAGTGDSIMNSLFGIVCSISATWDEIATATAEWAASVDFSPLLSEVDKLSNALTSLFDNVGSDLSSLYENDILPIFTYVIESGLPRVLNGVTNIINAVNNVTAAFDEAWEEGENGNAVLNGVKSILDSILTTFENITLVTAEWAVELDLTPLVTSISSAVSSLAPIVDDLGDTLDWIYTDIMLPLAKWVLEEAAPTSIDALTSALDLLEVSLSDVSDGLQSLWNTVLSPIIEWVEGVAIGVINKFKNSFDKLTDTIDARGGEIETAFEDIGTTINLVWAYIEPTLSSFANITGATFTALVASVSADIGQTIDTISGLAEFVAGVFTGDWSKAWDGITKVVNGVVTMIQAKLDAILTWMSDVFNSDMDYIKSIVCAGFEDIKETVTIIADTAKGSFDSMSAGIASTVSIISTTVKNAFATMKTSISNIMNSISTAISNVWNSIWSSIKKVINSILAGIESFCNAIVKGINTVIKALNTLNIDVPDWVTSLTGMKSIGFNIKTISEVSIPRLAEGGTVDTGQMFIAREAGAELVGSVGSKTTVMNNDDIVKSVSEGVAEANTTQNTLLREQNSLLRQLLAKDSTVTAVVSADSIVSGLSRKNRRDGKTIVPVGT